MSKPVALGRLGETLLYLFGFWISLTVLIIAFPWAPKEAFMQSARVVLVGFSGVALFVCAIGSATGLLGLSGMSPKPEAAPRPYDTTPRGGDLASPETAHPGRMRPGCLTLLQ